MEELKNIIKNTEGKMKKTIEVYKDHLKTIRTGRANPGLLDGIMVSYYGVDTPIAQVGNISAPEPNLLVVQPWDKTAIKDIEKAVISSERGLNPNNDGDILRIPIPALTEERRIELVKQVKKMAEEFKVQIRNARHDGNNDLKKLDKGSVSEDSLGEAEDEIQKLTNSYIEEIDTIFNNKEESIMEI